MLVHCLQGAPVLTPDQAWEADNIEDGSTILVNGMYYRFFCAGNCDNCPKGGEQIHLQACCGLEACTP
jgi:hypothetical protein